MEISFFNGKLYRNRILILFIFLVIFLISFISVIWLNKTKIISYQDVFNRYISAWNIKDEIQLADSGYGQGEILLNPLHLAVIYSSFVNNGNMIKPYLKYEETAKSEIWKSNVFSKEIANTILKDLTQVVENPRGTGHQAFVEGLNIAGKTGTAEIKLSQNDLNGTELGWFAAIIQDKPSLLVIAMAEDVKARGGSHYVVPMVRKVFEK
jgi:penicillin-binding protein